MSWVTHKAEYERIARSIDGSVKLVTKDHWIWKMIAVLVMLFTFGGISYKKFLTRYATTIGPIQGYPKEWPSLSHSLLVHEARHTRQARWFGLWIHPWVGLPVFAVLYLLIFFPLGLAYFRYRFELDADCASWKWQLKNGVSPGSVRMRAVAFAKLVCGGNYGWSWFWGVRGFEKTVEKVIADYEQQTKSSV